MFVVMPLLIQLTHFLSGTLHFHVSCALAHFLQIGGVPSFFSEHLLAMWQLSDSGDVIRL